MTDTYDLRGVGKSKLDAFRPEIEALLNNGSTQRFIARRYGTTLGNSSRWLNKHKLLHSPKLKYK